MFAALNLGLSKILVKNSDECRLGPMAVGYTRSSGFPGSLNDGLAAVVTPLAAIELYNCLLESGSR